MGIFVNPDNSAFQRALNSRIYVDKTGLLEEMNSVLDTEQCCICNSRPRRFGKSIKTGLLEEMNSVLDTEQCCICNSRPRRFGKSITANMMTAYYSCGCDSIKLFESTKISKSEQFLEHLNRYDVIHLDVQWCSMD